MSNGDVITVDKTTGNVVDRVPGGNNTGNTNTNPSGSTGTSTNASTSAGTSPKTGEF